MTDKTNYVVEGQLSDNERLKAESRHLRGMAGLRAVALITLPESPS